MSISVYLKAEDHLAGPAKHKTTRVRAELLLDIFFAETCGQNAIQLTVEGSWKQVKARAFGTPDHPGVPGILPPRGPEGLLLTYPLPDQRSNRIVLFLTQ